QSVTQNIHVVPANVRNNTQFGRNDISAIKSASQASFNNGYFECLFSKAFKSHRHRDLKKAWIYFFNKGLYPFSKLDDKFFAHHFPIYLNSFAKVFEMG